MKHCWILLVTAALAGGCASQGRLARLKENQVSAVLNLPQEATAPLPQIPVVSRDTATLQDDEGRQLLIMKAVKDEDGEMVATDVIQAAVVTARFRNVAERNGKVDLCFDVRVPETMMGKDWQLRFYPHMALPGDTLDLDPVHITGTQYRKMQLRGYEQYNRFLASIAADSARFVHTAQLEVFLERNLPQVYRFRNDSSFVSDEDFASAFGVTSQAAAAHYTARLLVQRNARKVARREKMFRKYVKVPILENGLRLDTVLKDATGEFVYRYVQTITAGKDLRKVGISLDGEIYQQEKCLYKVPESEPLTFYISSLSTFAEPAERFVTEIISRSVEANTACYIDFGAGESAVRPEREGNRTEIARIRENLASLVDDDRFDLDSITITASCSPEGTYAFNEQLSRRRSHAVSDYFQRFLKAYRDSTAGLRMSLAGAPAGEQQQIRFLSRNQAENWEMLRQLVRRDSTLSAAQKADLEVSFRIPDPDRREAAMQGLTSYRYLREKLYPRLRTVCFDFHLHRRGMIQDTIRTVIPDTVYARGVRALHDRDYKTAVRLLRPYADFNTAVAYLAMDMNASALAVLGGLPETDKTDYMKAILYSRQGNEAEAVRLYTRSCEKNRTFISRGNLDPEIASLIKKYGLHRELFQTTSQF